MELDIKIEPTVPEYYERMGEIAVKAWTDIYEGYRQQLGEELFEGFFHNRRERKIRVTTEQAETGISYVAITEGRVVAFINFRCDGAVGEILGNAVDPAFQGYGLGTRLQAFALDKMREQGCRFVFVETGGDPAHLPARCAYRKNGFEIGIPSITYYQKL